MSGPRLPLLPPELAWSDRRAVITGQVVFAVLYAGGLLLGLLPSVDVADREFAVVGAVLTVAALSLAVALPIERWPRVFARLLPFLDVVAILLLERGAADDAVLLNGLALVPVVTLAWSGGRAGALLGTLAGALASYLPVLWVDELADIGGTVVRAVFFPVVCLALSVFVAQVADLARDRADRLARLAHELTQSRDTMAELIDAATEQAIIGTDAVGTIEFFNRGAERMTGWSAAEAKGRAVVDLAVAEELDAVVRAAGVDPGPGGGLVSRRRAAVAAASAGGVHEFDLTLLRRGEAAGVARVVVTRRGDQDDAGYLLVASDVTRARELEEAKSQFVGYVSHELRTPISSVLGYTDLLRTDDENLTAEQRENLDVVERNARRLLHLVDDLLTTAQADAGTFSVRRQPTDLRDVVAAAVRSARPQADSAGVTLVDDSGGPAPLDGDPVRLAQMVDNLVSNAVKFTPSGGTVTLRAARAGDGVALTVRDTGPGIAPDEVERLTERFFRARAATQQRVPGVGLGLAITKAIVEAHGGTLSIASTVGEGSTFTVVLPGPGRGSGNEVADGP